MDKYSGLTDFEINKAVALALGLTLAEKQKPETAIVLTVEEYLLKGQFPQKSYKAFDWCHIHGNCMKLMLDFNIGLMNLDGTNLWIAFTRARFETVCMTPDSRDNGVSVFEAKHEVHHTRPLRAVCECFLKMRGDTNGWIER